MSTQITEGARSLRAYLLNVAQTVPDFCEKHGLSRQIVQRALNGQQTTFSVDFALTVQKATGGAVAADSWSQNTLREAAPEELGRLFPRHRPRSGATGHTVDDAGEAEEGPVVIREDFDQTGTGG